MMMVEMVGASTIFEREVFEIIPLASVHRNSKVTDKSIWQRSANPTKFIMINQKEIMEPGEMDGDDDHHQPLNSLQLLVMIPHR